MSERDRLEIGLRDLLEEVAPRRAPEDLTDRIMVASATVRRRPRWLTSMTVRSMRGEAGISVGSPSARAAAFVVLTVSLLVLALGTVVLGYRILVPPAIIVAADGSGDFTTIVAALDVADDGDTILVREGTYEESVVIEADITLRGDAPSRDLVVVRIPGDEIGIRLDDSAATVESLTVHSTAERPVFSAIDVAGGSALLRDLEVHSTADHQFTAIRLLATEAGLLDSDVTGRVVAGAGSNVRMDDNDFRRGDPGVVSPVLGTRGASSIGDGVFHSVEISGVGTTAEMSGNRLESIGIREGAIGTLRENEIGGAQTPAELDRSGDYFGCAVVSVRSRLELIDNEIHGSDTGVCGGAIVEGGRIHGNEVAFFGGLGELGDGIPLVTISDARIEDNIIAFELTRYTQLLVEGSWVCDNAQPDRIDPAVRVVFRDEQPCE